jgi:hypothetical protein
MVHFHDRILKLQFQLQLLVEVPYTEPSYYKHSIRNILGMGLGRRDLNSECMSITSD